jgi:hypothetical protein
MVTVAEELPELAEWVSAGLAEQGREDLIAALERQPIYACSVRGGAAGLLLVPPEVADPPRMDPRKPAGYMYDERRERVYVGRPKGRRFRWWGVTIDAIDGEIIALSVSHPGVLRPAFKKLERRLAKAGG